jgi:hypothetical protein
MYGDTSAIRALADRLRHRADDLRATADDLLAQSESVAWTGLAADAMRRAAREHATRLGACADAHRDAADALDRHARDVDQVKHAIAEIEHRALRLLGSATSGLSGLVGHVLPDAVCHWAHHFDPPPHGSRAWLDVHLPSAA